MIPHSRPNFGEPFLQAAERVIRSGQLAQGGEVARLEAVVAKRFGQSSAVAVDSGSSAIMLALQALKMTRSVQRVGIPAYGCRALYFAVRAAGAEPVCMDCGDDLRLDTTKANETAQTVDAVVLVHPFGMIEPMVAAAWPCPIIEDVAQSAGGTLDGKPLGSFGDVAVTSFYATKPWGGAYGGVAVCRDEMLADTMRHMRDADTAEASLPYAGNHHLSDMHAALALVRIELAAVEAEKRMSLAHQYDAWLTDAMAVPVERHLDGICYRYIVRAPEGGAEACIGKLHSLGVGAARPVAVSLDHLTGGETPVARRAVEECVSLPLLPDMSEQERFMMREAIQACMR